MTQVPEEASNGRRQVRVQFNRRRTSERLQSRVLARSWPNLAGSSPESAARSRKCSDPAQIWSTSITNTRAHPLVAAPRDVEPQVRPPLFRRARPTPEVWFVTCAGQEDLVLKLVRCRRTGAASVAPVSRGLSHESACQSCSADFMFQCGLRYCFYMCDAMRRNSRPGCCRSRASLVLLGQRSRAAARAPRGPSSCAARAPLRCRSGPALAPRPNHSHAARPSLATLAGTSRVGTVMKEDRQHYMTCHITMKYTLL